MLVIQTQDQENYGAHDWDGQGACPQYWKFKGGQDYKVTGVPADVDPAEVVEMVRTSIEESSEYFRVDIIGYGMETDDYLSQFERSQLEMEGSIGYPEPTIEYSDLMMIADYEAYEEYADQDCYAYGEAV